MAENKTKPEAIDVEGFLEAVDPQRRDDARALCALMAEVSGESPTMWGASIVGFGRHHYRYESGREGDTFLVGFSPRKQNLTLYIIDGFERHGERLAALGPHKLGKSCLYLKSLRGIDQGALRAIVADALAGAGQEPGAAGYE